MAKETEITIRRPDDWHLHLRDGAMMGAVLPYTAARFARAIIMPNLTPPVLTVSDARAYRQRIIAALPKGAAFAPLMTAYLTDDTDAEDLIAGFEDGTLAAVKYYPAGATTNSQSGVTDIAKTHDVLARMEKAGMPLLMHGETTDPAVDVYDREAVFIERTLEPLTRRFPGLKVVLEHITTADGVAFVEAAGPTVAATVTVHHMMINRTDMFRGGIRPHLYCLPVAKRERHRLAVRASACSGSPKFFLGTDSAPHPKAAKESACGCAGIFSAPAALELYAQAFADDGALGNFEAFASLNGPAFYGLATNETKITLKKEDVTVPGDVDTGDGAAVSPFMAGETVSWRLAD